MSGPHVAIDPRDADPLIVLEDQDHPLIWVERIDRAAGDAEAWERGYAAAEDDRRGRIAGLLLAALSGAVIGAVLATVALVAAVHAAPRSAQTTERVDVSALSSAGLIGAPSFELEPSGIASSAPLSAVGSDAPYPDGTRLPAGGAPLITEPAAIAGGLASYVAPSYGPRYLALPEGPGHRVRICGPSACVVRTSTDTGPDLAMQRAGRIADLSFADFATVCGCEPSLVGVIPVSVEDVGAGPTPPATDMQP